MMRKIKALTARYWAVTVEWLYTRDIETVRKGFSRIGEDTMKVSLISFGANLYLHKTSVLEGALTLWFVGAILFIMTVPSRGGDDD